MTRYQCRQCGHDYITRIDPTGDQRLGGVSLPTTELVRCSNAACELSDPANRDLYLVMVHRVED